jgi:acyl-CoA synthetase (NDP forming)
MMARNENFDFLIAIMTDPHHKHQQDHSVESYLQQFKLEGRNHKPLLAVVSEKGLGIDDYDNWSWKLMCEVRTELIATRIPFYPTVERAATAARKFVEYYRAKGEPDKI